MKRALAKDEGKEEILKCKKRLCLNHAAPSERLSLKAIRKQLAKIKAWTDAVGAWTSLSSPLPGIDGLTADWLKDYYSGHYEPHNNGKFVLFVRHVLAGIYRQAPTEVVTRIVDKYIKVLADYGPDWDSPIELLLCRLLLCDHFQQDFLDLACELIKDDDPSELIGLCCWAISARQIDDISGGQQDYTRSAVANLVALVLTLKGQEFTYSAFSYDFVFYKKGGVKVEIWMPEFARFWFGVEMPNFCEKPSRIEEFRGLLAQ